MAMAATCSTWRSIVRPAGRTRPLDTAALSTLLQQRAALYDKDQEAHYNLISALHKSVRGSIPTRRSTGSRAC